MIVTALNAAPSDTGNSSIVFIPEGKNIITPTVNGKPKQITVNVSASNGPIIAARLQNDLESRKSQNVRPIFDFDHNDTGPAAGLPQQFSYEPGKGIMIDVEWSGAGDAAIKAKDYSYFSPVFQLGKDGTPSGLPKRGPLGALVNDPAFRDIPRIAAACAADHIETQEIDMSELVKCGLLKDSEAAKDNAENIAAARVASLRQDSDKVEALNSKVTDLETENKELKDKVEAAAADMKASKKKEADTLVMAAVADGRLAPKDQGTQDFYRDSIISQGDPAVKALAALPKQHEGITEQKVKAKATKEVEVELSGYDAVEAALAKELEQD